MATFIDNTGVSNSFTDETGVTTNFTKESGVTTTFDDLEGGVGGGIAYDDPNYTYDDIRVWYDGGVVSNFDIREGGIINNFIDLTTI